MAQSTIPARPEADCVIEIGTYGLWTYRKWKSGISECWGTYSAQLTHYAGGNGFYAYRTPDLDLPPSLFNATPSVTADGIIGSGFYMGSLTMGSATLIAIAAMSTSSNLADCTFHIKAIGRWQ